MANQLPVNQSQADQPQNDQTAMAQPNQTEIFGDNLANNEQLTKQNTNESPMEQSIENNQSEEGSKTLESHSQENAEKQPEKVDAAMEEILENSAGNKSESKSNEQAENDIETKPPETSEETSEEKTTDSSEAQPENKPEAQPEMQPETQLESEDMQIEEESKPVPSADIGLSLDDLIAKKKSETKSQSNDINPMEMMQKMMAMMSGQIPMVIDSYFFQNLDKVF